MSAQLYKLLFSTILRKTHTEHYINHNDHKLEPKCLEDELCCLCLNSVDKEATSVEDVIAFSMGDKECSFGITISKILRFLFGESISEVTSILRSVCKECLHSAIACFKFIRYCRTNFDLLSKAVEKLDHCLDIPDETFSYKTMYITIAPEEFTKKTVIRRYFDKNRQLIPQDTALPRLQMILESIHPKTSLCTKINPEIKEILFDSDKPNEYKCKICEEMFKDDACLQIHFLKKHHHKKDFKCIQCDKFSIFQWDFINKFEFTATAENHNYTPTNAMVEYDTMATTAEVENANTKENHVDAEESERNFDYMDSPAIDFEDTPEVTEEVTVTNTAEELDDENSHQIYTCLDCNGTFPSLLIFTHHREKFSGRCRKEKYQCDICKHVFTYKGSMLKHNCSEVRVRTLLCDICGKNFTSKRALNYHRLNHNSAPKISVCPICHKNFKYSNYLKMHMKYHSNERPFQCDFCPQPFKTKQDLLRHVVYRHKPATVPCDQCKQLFPSIDLLSKHKKIAHHGNQKATIPKHFCKICHKGFRKKSIALDHEKRHDDDPAEECDLCKRKFRASSDMLKHRRKHYNVKSSIYISNINNDS